MDSSQPPDFSTWPGIIGALGVAAAAGLTWLLGKRSDKKSEEQITPSAREVVAAEVAKALAERERIQAAEEARAAVDKSIGDLRQDCQLALSNTRKAFFDRMDEGDEKHQALREQFIRLEERLNHLIESVNRRPPR